MFFFTEKLYNKTKKYEIQWVKTSYNTNQPKNDQKSRKKISSIFWLSGGSHFGVKGG